MTGFKTWRVSNASEFTGGEYGYIKLTIDQLGRQKTVLASYRLQYESVTRASL